MAGIGFELRKMMDSSSSLLSSIKSFGLATVIINGPMVLCMITVSFANFILGNGIYSGVPSDGILTTITCAFIISSVITGSYSLVLTRYISDCIFKKEYTKIFPSMIGAIIPALFFSIASSVSMVLWGGLKYEYGITVFILFLVVSIVWLEMIYLSAVKNYISIIKGFFIGNMIGILMLLLIGHIPEGWKLQYVFLCFITGFSITAGLLMYQISIFFGEGTGSVAKWAGYIKKFPSLFLTGLFYSLGLYFICIHYRLSSGEIFNQGFFALKPEFDLPFFWAVLGMIPGLVYFSTRFETALHTNSKELYLKINNNGTGAEIDYFTQNVVSIVKYYCIKLALVQGIVMLIMLLLPFATMEINKTVYVFWMLTIGLCATLFMYAVILVVLYFDGRGYALAISFIFMSLNILLTLFFDNYATGSIGLGFMAGSVISMILSIILLMIFMVKIKNYIFIMKQ